jgi:hypothetical protein
MQSTAQTGEQQKCIAKLFDSDEELKRFQQHFRDLIEGSAFRGSQRSGQFLTYVVEQAIAGHLSSLKERTIGVEVFGRSPSYNTGEDAIVRVTASDVRKRLQQHYGRYGADSEFRINLPPGHYIPEIVREVPPDSPSEAVFPASEEPTAVAPSRIPALTESPPETVASGAPQNRPLRSVFLLLLVLLLLGNVGAWLILFRQHSGWSTKPPSVAPWSAMLRGTRSTLLITSDPNIAEIQGLTGSDISTSDYANQLYIPLSNSLSPEVYRFVHDILRGDKAANVDLAIVASVAQLAQAASSRISVRGARDFRLSELDTENNFIFIGSPRTDPWTGLFNEQLDFRFHFDGASKQETIQNVRPHPGEASAYVPTAKGFATGESYATVSFIGNPDHAGQVLLLSGLNAEGTKAAGQFVTNLTDLQAALTDCGIHSTQTGPHFQMLLRLSTMAGSPRHWDVLACHRLP